MGGLIRADEDVEHSRPRRPMGGERLNKRLETVNWHSTAVIGNLIGIKGYASSLGSGGMTDNHKVMKKYKRRATDNNGIPRRGWRWQDYIRNLACWYAPTRVPKGKPGLPRRYSLMLASEEILKMILKPLLSECDCLLTVHAFLGFRGQVRHRRRLGAR